MHNAAGTRHFDLTFADMTREAFLHSIEVNVWSGWELARLQLHADGTRKAIMRRRARLSYLPKPAL